MINFKVSNLINKKLYKANIFKLLMINFNCFIIFVKNLIYEDYTI